MIMESFYFVDPGPDAILFPPQDAMGALAARAQLHNSKGRAKNSGMGLRLGVDNMALAHRHANSSRFEVDVQKIKGTTF